MLTLKNGMWGHHHNSTVNFYDIPIENSSAFESNLLRQPKDWEYRSKIIEYKYNSAGHRSIDLPKVDKGYILFTGCSFTEGVGLSYDDIYSTKIANYLGKQHYNLALGGSGVDLLVHNLIMFLTVIKIKPSAVFIQWPDFNRYLTVDDRGYELWGQVNTVSNKDRLFMLTEELSTFKNLNLYYRQLLITYLKSVRIPYYEIWFNNMNFVDTDSPIKLDIIDLARDLMHPGSKSNDKLANEILNHFGLK
jgi:hypothetical protein